MVRVIVEDDPNTLRSPDDTVEVIQNVPIDDVIKLIQDSNDELNNEINVLIVNHPLVNFKLLNEDHEVIEPTILEEILGSIHNQLIEKNYSFILISNIESYVLRNNDSTVMSHHMTKLADILEILDDYHVEIYVTLSENFYKNNYTIFDTYLD